MRRAYPRAPRSRSIARSSPTRSRGASNRSRPIELVREEVPSLGRFADDTVIVASGPLTSPALYEDLRTLLRPRPSLFLRCDLADRDRRVDRSHDRLRGIAIRQGRRRLSQLSSRPRRVRAGSSTRLLGAEKVPTREFEKCIYFEGCMPIEELARRGPQTLAFGPMRPVGLGRSAERQTAARGRPAPPGRSSRDSLLARRLSDQDDLPRAAQSPAARSRGSSAPSSFASGACTATHSFTPPRCSSRRWSFAAGAVWFFAGQLIGVEGYVESAASGLLAGINAGRSTSAGDRASRRRPRPRSGRCSPTSRIAAARTSSR